MDRKEKTISLEEIEKKFDNEQEKQHYIDEIWSKVRKKENIRKWIDGSCLIAGLVAAYIIWTVFGDSLPKWLTERSGRRGSNLLVTIGYIGGFLIGEGISRLLIKLMKLDE